jgi:hypothetical protein
LFGGGSTITLGPVGRVAHPPSTTRTSNKKTPLFSFIISSLLHVRRNRRRNDLHPAARTLLHIWIIALRIPAVIPIILLLLLRGRLDIYLRLLLDYRRR